MQPQIKKRKKRKQNIGLKQIIYYMLELPLGNFFLKNRISQSDIFFQFFSDSARKMIIS